MAGALGASAVGAASQPQTRSFAANTENKDLRQPQLFLDDTWIEETYRLERSWEQAEIFPEPVLRPETAVDGYQIVIAQVVRTYGDGNIQHPLAPFSRSKDEHGSQAD